MLVHRTRADAGQAMTEYAILLALVSGLNWLQRVTQSILEQPPAMLVGGVVVIVVCIFAFAGRRS